MSAPLLFIRHGETDWNREARLQGRKDIPLNAHGRRQAARNGRAIAGMLRALEWRYVASPLARAAETMRIVLANAGRPETDFSIDPVLMEISYGDWEGLTLLEVAARDAVSAAGRESDKWNFCPPAGESYCRAAGRVGAWLERLDGPTCVVAHGGILRIAMHLLAGLPSHDAPHLAAPQDRVVLFDGKGVLSI